MVCPHKGAVTYVLNVNTICKMPVAKALTQVKNYKIAFSLISTDTRRVNSTLGYVTLRWVALRDVKLRYVTLR